MTMPCRVPERRNTCLLVTTALVTDSARPTAIRVVPEAIPLDHL
jgi:hypothetical protein